MVFEKIKARLHSRRLNGLADMKRKTRSLNEKKKQYIAEDKIKKDYAKAKSEAHGRSWLGQAQKGVRSYQKRAKKRGSSGIFAEEGRSTKRKQRSMNDDDPFKKWGL